MNKTRIIAIDGACRNNGKPDCISAGGIFVQDVAEGLNFVRPVDCSTCSTYEIGSTSQRGEMLALLAALDFIVDDYETYILTDSEYLFNAITKQWSIRWANTGWLTADGNPIANQDLWEQINKKLLRNTILSKPDPLYYHIKGHLMPFGKVSAADLLSQDPSGYTLYNAAHKKFEVLPAIKQNTAIHTAKELSEKNMGYQYSSTVIHRFISLNLVADAVATQCVERVKALQP